MAVRRTLLPCFEPLMPLYRPVAPGELKLPEIELALRSTVS